MAAQFITFETRAVQNNYLTKQEGRPMFDKKDYIKIINAGSSDEFFQPWDSLVESMKDLHRERYEAWKSKRGYKEIDGTPIDQVPFLSVIEVAELKGVNILTLEALAEINESVIAKIPFLRDKKNKAIAFINSAKQSSESVGLVTEAKKLKEDLEEAKEYIKELESKIRELNSEKPAKKSNKKED